MEKPYSVKADEQGVTTGEFIVSNASVASLMEKKEKNTKQGYVVDEKQSLQSCRGVGDLLSELVEIDRRK